MEDDRHLFALQCCSGKSSLIQELQVSSLHNTNAALVVQLQVTVADCCLRSWFTYHCRDISSPPWVAHHAACSTSCFLLAPLPTMAARRFSYSSCRCIRLPADSRSLKSLCLSTFLKSSLSASPFPSNCSGSYLEALFEGMRCYHRCVRMTS